jgi:hypothetical protein
MIKEMTVPEIRRPQAIAVLFSNQHPLAPAPLPQGKEGSCFDFCCPLSPAWTGEHCCGFCSPLPLGGEGGPRSRCTSSGRGPGEGVVQRPLCMVTSRRLLAVQDHREGQGTVASPLIPGIRHLHDAENWNWVVVSFGVGSISKHRSFPRKRESSL